MATKWATTIVLICFALALAIVLLVAAATRDWTGKIARDLRDRSSAQKAGAFPKWPPSAPPPSYEPSDWITTDDYPPAAIRAEEQGTVRIRWTVDMKGRATRCDVIASSGHRSLDRAACHAILRSARYRLAPGLAGQTFERRISWRLPEE